MLHPSQLLSKDCLVWQPGLPTAAMAREIPPGLISGILSQSVTRQGNVGNQKRVRCRSRVMMLINILRTGCLAVGPHVTVWYWMHIASLMFSGIGRCLTAATVVNAATLEKSGQSFRCCYLGDNICLWALVFKSIWLLTNVFQPLQTNRHHFSVLLPISPEAHSGSKKTMISFSSGSILQTSANAV